MTTEGRTARNDSGGFGSRRFAGARGGRGRRKLVFENRHQSRIAAYLVNCLAPRDAEISVTGQNRNYEQSFYELEYSQGSPPLPLTNWLWIAALGVLLLARFLMVRNM